MKKILTFIIVSALFAGLFDRKDNQKKEDEIKHELRELNMDVNNIIERYKRFDLRLIGMGKDIQIMMDSINVQNQRYNDKMESIDDEFQLLHLKLDNLTEVITPKLERLDDEQEDLYDQFRSFKRKQNRDTREIKMNIQSLQVDFDNLDRQLNPKKYSND